MKECATLADAGYDVVLVARRTEDAPVTMTQLVEAPRSPGRLARILTSGRRMYDVATSIDADIYHLHDPELLPTAHRLVRNGYRAIYDSHEYLSKSVAGREYLPHRIAPLIGAVVGAYEAWAARRLTAVIAATPTIAGQFDPSRTTVVTNYPRLSEFGEDHVTDPAEYTDRPRAAGYIGVLTAERCAPEMVSAGGILARSDAEIRLAGPAGPTLSLESPGVSYLGVLPRTRVPPELARLRVGICVFKPLPNHIEALPTKVFEYMAAGIPVVVSRSTEVMAGIVERSRSGVVIESEDPAAIAEATLELLDDPSAAFEMGQRGRSAVSEEYSWESQEPILLDLYERLLVDRAVSTSRGSAMVSPGVEPR